MSDVCYQERRGLQKQHHSTPPPPSPTLLSLSHSLSLFSLTNAPNHQHRITHIICVLCSLNMPRVICTARLYFLCNNGIRHKALSDQHTHTNIQTENTLFLHALACAQSTAYADTATTLVHSNNWYRKFYPATVVDSSRRVLFVNAKGTEYCLLLINLLY